MIYLGYLKEKVDCEPIVNPEDAVAHTLLHPPELRLLRFFLHLL